VAESLVRVVADTYALAFQTQSFHWNVRGPHFAALHRLFEEQYTELSGSVDELAERVRALGQLAPTSLREIANFTTIPLDHGAPPAQVMVQVLLQAHELLARGTRHVAELAEQTGDTFTHDMLVARTGAHEKAAWMLRATLEE
jgi:starvation-inducible DNA-binding protein